MKKHKTFEIRTGNSWMGKKYNLASDFSIAIYVAGNFAIMSTDFWEINVWWIIVYQKSFPIIRRREKDTL